MRSVNLEKEISRKQTIIVDSSMEIQGTVDWTKAVTLVATDEAYVLIPRADGSLVRSPSISIPHPLVVCLNRYVPRRNTTIRADEVVSRKVILVRDDWTCQYCGEYGDTIDHIFPKSRGGGNTWGNLCVACKDCNGAKSDLTPKEAGLRQPVIPSVYSPKRQQILQTAIYKELEAMAV